jgi:hypothetical protein
MTTIDRVTFPAAWETRVETHLSDIPISIISLDDLIRNKEAASGVAHALCVPCRH